MSSSKTDDAVLLGEARYVACVLAGMRPRAGLRPPETPRSWLALLDVLFDGSWNPSLERFRSPYAFRGHALRTEDLSSGLLRLAAGRSDVAHLEHHLLRNFRKYAHGRTGGSIWKWLALAQHRGLPTRLLDWTYSPFVALHFATADLSTMDQDGEVWAINFVAANRYLPRAVADILRSEGSDTVTVEMLGTFRTLEAFDRLARQPFVVFLEPPSLDRRIVNQFALFSLMSNPQARLDHWMAGHAARVRRIVIPASLKWEVRDKLDQANINERVLFPGLDGLSRWLTRYYWRKPAHPRPLGSRDEAARTSTRLSLISGRRSSSSSRFR